MSRAYADLPLHYGRVPEWLAVRMRALGGAIIEALVQEYGRGEVLSRLSDPFWFQALGAVLGMDWHSSGITTSVMGALKGAVNSRSNELGIYICGGRGAHSRKTPDELRIIGNRTGLNATELIRSSRLAAKVDNTAVQDGFQIYLHSFILTKDGEWAVVQQGLNDKTGMARRYHWHSPSIKSFLEAPHAFIYGQNQGQILNLTDKDASSTRSGVLALTRENPARIIQEVRHLVMPGHHEVTARDVDLKRLGSVLAVAQEREVLDTESLLLLEGIGPRTLQSLVLVSEVIHGTPSRFTDPARFSFAHGGKDGHPFPVPLNVYDETIKTLDTAVRRAKLGQSDKAEAIKNLGKAAQSLEAHFIPNNNFEALVEQERRDSWKYGGRTVHGKAQKPKDRDVQGKLF
jgi:hypothetical protein